MSLVKLATSKVGYKQLAIGKVIDGKALRQHKKKFLNKALFLKRRDNYIIGKFADNFKHVSGLNEADQIEYASKLGRQFAIDDSIKRIPDWNKKKLIGLALGTAALGGGIYGYEKNLKKSDND